MLVKEKLTDFNKTIYCDKEEAFKCKVQPSLNTVQIQSDI